MAVAEIGKKDLIWTFAATFFKIGAGVLLFPFILKMLPAETVGVWSVFTTITLLSSLFDFGFNQSFARNVAYVFSGVRRLKLSGYERVDTEILAGIDYNLLGNTIKAMRFFYSRVAAAVLALLFTGGTYYVYLLTDGYCGDVREVYVAWAILCAVNCYNLYTLYYESLLTGAGLVKIYNQIVLAGNVVYVALAAVLLMCGFGLVAVVSSQAVTVLLIRMLSRRAFYTIEIKQRLAGVQDGNYVEVLKIIAPNAVKLGISGLCGFVVNRAGLLIGSLYVSLEDMASFGISLQLAMLVTQVAYVLTKVYLPKIYQWRVENRVADIRRMFYLTSAFTFVVFVVAGVVILLWGDRILTLLDSNTLLLPTGLLLLLFVQRYLEANHVNASDFLLSRNEVPFFRASIFSAVAVAVLLVIFVVYIDMGLWGIVLAPTLVQATYQNWRWPLMVWCELRVHG